MTNLSPPTRIDTNSENKNKPILEWGTWIRTLADAQPFDLIEINRYNGIYQHWVMYLGRGNVIHVTQIKDRTEGSNAEKRVDKLAYVARKDVCRINNLNETASQKGLSKRTDEQILDAIKDIVTVPLGELRYQTSYSFNRVTIVPYTAMDINCEYYATLWRYGEGFSKQAEDIKNKDIPLEKIMASVEMLEDLEGKD